MKSGRREPSSDGGGDKRDPGQPILRPGPRAGFFQRMRNNFLTGIVVVAPFVITIYLTWTIIDYVDSTVLPKVLPFIPEQYRPENLLPFYLPGLGVIVFAIFLIFVGSFTKNFFGRELLKIGERWVDRMPVVRSLYNALKQIAETIFTQSKSSFDRACLVEYPRKGIWAVAFVSTDTKGEIPKKATDGAPMISVFLPTTPNPTSGFLLFVPKSDVILLDMTVEEAAKLVISAGLVTPSEVSKLQEKPSEPDVGPTVHDDDPRGRRWRNRRNRRGDGGGESPAGAGEAAARNPFNQI